MTEFTDTEPGAVFTFSGTEDFFETLYGIPVTATGELCEGLLALGHLADRAVLAVTNAYHRRIYGHRILPAANSRTWSTSAPGTPGSSPPAATKTTTTPGSSRRATPTPNRRRP
ncbi:hypothetical protein ACFPH6_21365 [Streptomyces xiangluensis]|uniref:Uncharacterized protein n=1 Tax=Streptomyces xiangluensis TaxID=2665720 RepID=A0ABV8YSL7_9ACTN